MTVGSVEEEIDWEAKYEEERAQRDKLSNQFYQQKGRIDELSKDLERAKADASSYLRHVESLQITIARLSGYIDRVKELEGNIKPIQNQPMAMEVMPQGYNPDYRGY